MTRFTMTSSRLRPLTIVLIIVVGIATTACETADEIRGRYAAEKLAWQAAKLSQAVGRNPDLATDEMRAGIAAKYREIVSSFPPPAGDVAGLSTEAVDIAFLAGQSRLILAGLAVKEDDLDEAARLYASVRDSYAFDRTLVLEGSFSLASVEERKDRWEEAVRVYEELLDRWPPAESSDAPPDARILRTPLYVAGGYQLRGDGNRAGAWYGRARDYYRDWISRWPGTLTAERAASLTAESFTHEERWDDAARAYLDFDRLHGDPENRASVWLGLAEIYETRLARRDLATQYYGRVEEEYRDDLSGAAAAIALARADLSAGRPRHAAARLEDVVERFGDEQTVAATAMHYLALAREMNDEWDKAAVTFYELARKYPTTIYGLTAHLHVAERYGAMGESEAAAGALERAAEHYSRVVRDHASTRAELVARAYLIDTRIEQEAWVDAASMLVETAELFPDSAASPAMLLQASEIYGRRLDDVARAQGVLEALIRAYPDGPWAEEAGRRAEALGR